MEGEELDDEVEEGSYMAPVMRQRLEGRWSLALKSDSPSLKGDEDSVSRHDKASLCERAGTRRRMRMDQWYCADRRVCRCERTFQMMRCTSAFAPYEQRRTLSSLGQYPTPYLG